MRTPHTLVRMVDRPWVLDAPTVKPVPSSKAADTGEHNVRRYRECLTRQGHVVQELFDHDTDHHGSSDSSLDVLPRLRTHLRALVRGLERIDDFGGDTTASADLVAV